MMERKKRRRRPDKKTRRLRAVRAALLGAVLLLAAAAAFRGFTGTSSGRKKLRAAGIEKMESGNYAGAMADFEAALETSRKKAGAFEIDVLKYRAEAEYMLEDYQAASHTYDTLMQADQERAEYLYRAAAVKALGGDADGALDMYQRGVGLEKEAQETGCTERMEALALVGGACFKNGRTEDAAALYEDAVRDGSTDPVIFNSLGLIYMGSGHYQRALDFFGQAVQAGEGGGEDGGRQMEAVQKASFNQAAAYEYLGQYQTALQCFQAYVARFGPDEAAQKEIVFLQTR